MVLTTVNINLFVTGCLSQLIGIGKFTGKDGSNIEHKQFFYLEQKTKLSQCISCEYFGALCLYNIQQLRSVFLPWKFSERN